VLTAIAAVGLAAAAALASTGTQAGAVTRTAAKAAATAADAAGPPGRSVFVVTGQRVSAGGAGVRVLADGGAGSAGLLQVVGQGGTREVVPVTAAPFEGQSLAAALFEPGVLAGPESGGRLAVRIGYSAGLRALPGVTITSSGGGTAAGYLTAAGARVFGAAVARLYAADHARASYGQDGFLRGVDISLAGPPAPAPPARPEFPMRTLVVSGTDLSGRRDTGDLVGVVQRR